RRGGSMAPSRPTVSHRDVACRWSAVWVAALGSVFDAVVALVLPCPQGENPLQHAARLAHLHQLVLAHGASLQLWDETLQARVRLALQLQFRRVVPLMRLPQHRASLTPVLRGLLHETALSTWREYCMPSEKLVAALREEAAKPGKRQGRAPTPG